jgi:hypothetical protein
MGDLDVRQVSLVVRDPKDPADDGCDAGEAGEAKPKGHEGL